MKAFMPTREWIENLQVGDLALDCFGNLRKVVKIFFRSKNIHGKSIIGYYTEHGPTSSISHSLTEGKICATIPLGSKWMQMTMIPKSECSTDIMECGNL